ncbi:ABC transporter ATP-binding protein [Natrinema gari]|uniref:ABC transporter ATP-binding protein n=1 Tax=Natrinema gari TaxID=419186 RepID=UPI000677837D|nr:ABC transporter ATP-binding protein [Natrinema gari]
MMCDIERRKQVEGESTDSAIDVRGLRVTYADGTTAVDGIDMTVRKGEFFGYLGPNGAGKTTTIKVLATLLTPSDGEVRVNGFNVRTDSRNVRKSIGYMAQETVVDPELTVEENVRFACETYGVPRDERGRRISTLLSLVDLADVADKPADKLSGGMQKRLDAATALVHEPPVVFLDEPTTGLDPEGRDRLWDYFQRINDQGTTIVLTTQYLEEADKLCDRLVLVQDGSVIVKGSPNDLKGRGGDEILDVELTGDQSARRRAAEIARDLGPFNSNAIEETDNGISVTGNSVREHGTMLLVTLDEAGISVVGFDIRKPTLDDVFLAVTGEGLA